MIQQECSYNLNCSISLNYLLFYIGLINPLDGKPITNVYKEGETWSNKFPKMSSAMEECRADSVAMYLGNNDDVLKIFGVSEGKQS